MSLGNIVKVAIIGDERELKRAAKEGVKDLKEVGNAGDKSGSKLGKFAKVAGAGIAGGLAIGVAAMGIAIHAGDALNESQDMLAKALDDTHRKVADIGTVVGPTMKQMEKWGYTNEEVNTGLAKLVRSGDTLKKATDDISLAANIAKGRNISLASAEDLLVKVRTGHVALLGRYGIATKDATGKTISQTEAIQKLSEMYSGSADVASESLSGKTAALKAKFADFTAHVGQKLIPILLALVSFVVDKLLPAIGKIATWIQTKGIPAVIAFGEHVAEMYARYVEPTVNSIVNVFKGLVKQITGIFDLIHDIFTGKWSAIGADLKRIVSGMVQEVTGLFTGWVSSIGRLLGNGAGLLARAAGHIGSGIVNAIASAVKGGANLVIGIINDVIDLVDKFQIHIKSHKIAGVTVLPGFDWDGLQIPKLPYFHSGGVADFGSAGEGLAILRNGERVLTPEQQSTASHTTITHLHGSITPGSVNALQTRHDRRNGLAQRVLPDNTLAALGGV